ncbi:FAD-binding oxidoreductase [Rhizobium sp. AQ_MP]|uniref:FAD-binding oxidoreductase n=1 Tax=Rhizobium sp. AQ_MP TaxID=2761536 RepID=UPI00163A0288|nr:FAD-binding oxidoreductase [Rhizobium sp. AQ_MP]MBC2775486.1 FAD-binding oxidoreductase [Rhizobium sp. AQ_MP]
MLGAYDSFGRIDRRQRTALPMSDAVARLRGTTDASGVTVLPFGNGRSYGDSCHNDCGALVPIRAPSADMSLDAESGLLDAAAGVTLEDIIALVAPHGFFLPVTPGTRYVTLGGAIANDVHGKNHHLRGTFGCHVTSFELLRSNGESLNCSLTSNPEMFAATIGGMGLTGIITRARLQLMRVPSLDIDEQIVPFANLEDYFDQAEDADQANEYAVAWVDQLATGRSSGRGLLITGNHAHNGNRRAEKQATRLSVPFDLPFSALNRVSLSAFNAAYFAAKSRKRDLHQTGYGSFFYPLDGVAHWNRLYGPRGLFQHQSVIPFETARQTIPLLLQASRDAAHASFLTVLKRFGEVASPGILSFPKPGYTLTMDFPNRGAPTLALLERLDRLTIEAGGRVNPYKDQRMSAAIFQAGFPSWTELEARRDPGFLSNFWRRAALTPPHS